MKLLVLFILHCLILVLAAGKSGAQSTASVAGTVTGQEGEAAVGINIVLKGTSTGTATDVNGNYQLSGLPAGTATLIFSGIGYEALEQEVELHIGEQLRLNAELRTDMLLLKAATIRENSVRADIKQQAFSVNALEVAAVQNLNADVNQLLNASSGVNIREEGGLGSDFNFSLNGLSGKQVKFFIDGIPMENFGSSMSLNNLPVNLVERVEVYKGVVPVSLGADALGGAINIITKQTRQDFADLSYSFGSFNTHRTAFSGQWVNDSTGLAIRTRAFLNYSDNDYEVDVQVADPATGSYGEPVRLRRFHDAYQSQMVQVEAGLMNTKVADRLLAGVLASGNMNELQHGTSMDRVFGDVHTRDQFIMPSLQYSKKDLLKKGLSVNAYLSYGKRKSWVIDTSSRQYDWFGNYITRNNHRIGEASWQKSLFTFNDHSVQAVGNASYQKGRSRTDFNYTQSYLERTGEDPLATSPIPFANPNHLNKRVLALGHTLEMLQKRWSTSLFSKYYVFDSKVINVSYQDEVTAEISRFRKPGFGLASTFYFTDFLQLKTSYEKTYRLPEGHELFGNGLLLQNNPMLEPEESHNANLGLLLRKATGKNEIEAEVNGFYRNAKNLIRIEATGITSQYVNLAKARSSGIEAGFHYTWNRFLILGMNATYQDIINTTEFDGQTRSYVYLDRIPNIPWFFGNVMAGIQQRNVFFENDRIALNWSARYVEEYFLKWPSLGDPSNKHIIPHQFLQNLSATYSARDGRYNVTLGSNNIADNIAYDHFRLQKPGRSFYLKLRCFIESKPQLLSKN
ncbi:MAG: TonB-dependent receptor [Bacteroidia bacterium]